MSNTEFETALRRAQDTLDGATARVDALLSKLGAFEPAAPNEDSAEFEAAFLRPYYESVGLRGSPRATFNRLQARRRPVYARQAEAEVIASVVRASPLFDAEGYRARLKLAQTLDPALHYVIVGEEAGHAPSDGFDPVYYGERYFDVAALPLNRLWHFEAHGREEGRRARSVVSDVTFPRNGLDPKRKTVLVVSHDASRTGAPILAYNIAKRLRKTYNVVALLLHGGDLTSDFVEACNAVIGPLTYADSHDVDARRLTAALLEAYPLYFAIANSIESRIYVEPLARAYVPVVSLIHEFAAYTRPKGVMNQALNWSTHVVFSTDVTAQSAMNEYPTLITRDVKILPQGKCDMPGEEKKSKPERVAKLRKMMRPHGDRDFVVLGAGSVEFRKGVDLFLATAAAVARLGSERPVRFVWIGGGYAPDIEAGYSAYLSEQISRSGLENSVTIMDPVDDIDPVYALSDALFLSSRLDPLPNVTIDAAMIGLPVVCFERASGIATLMSADTTLRSCVVPYMDLDAAARALLRLANDKLAHAQTGVAMKRFGAAQFDIEGYVARVEALARDGVDRLAEQIADHKTIGEDDVFDAEVSLPTYIKDRSRDGAIREWLNLWSTAGATTAMAHHYNFRRPFAGFHPQIYAMAHEGHYDTKRVNPLAHYIRAGKPRGPWLHDVIVPQSKDPMAAAPGRTALQGHFYYTELMADLLPRLQGNRSECDLLLSTDTRIKAEWLRRATKSYDQGEVVVRVVPNRGRDIGAFLSGFGDLIGRYEIVGHVHGKRSPFAPAFGNAWREFLWQHLVGDAFPMMDLALARFAADARLGLVFAEDARLCDWDDNLKIGKALAVRLGVEPESLPAFFDFPNGTMFWARRSALQPLFDAKFDWTEYPEEPIAEDGTMLHALERLLPFVVQHQGFSYATTHVPGHVR